MESRPPKLPDVQAEVRRLLDRGAYYESEHALKRMWERGVLSREVRLVLRRGVRLEHKDEYDDQWDTWNYVIEGNATDPAQLIRVVFAVRALEPLPGEWIVVVTVITVD